MRPHEEEGAAVMEAVVRSFPKPEARCFRWAYPIWVPAPDLDPTQLKREKPRKSRTAEPAKAPTPPADTWDVPKFVARFLSAEGQTEATIMVAAKAAGISGTFAKQLLTVAQDQHAVHRWDFSTRDKAKYATVTKPLFDGSGVGS
jgi:hypothetical protein